MATSSMSDDFKKKMFRTMHRTVSFGSIPFAKLTAINKTVCCLLSEVL